MTGTLNVGDFNLKSGSFLTMYGGAHDQIVAHGTVRLDGSLTFGFLAPYPVPPGSSFTVIDNDGTDPVQGTFRDMSEGAMFLPGVRITYRGGDGNDVVVTVMATSQTAVSAGPGGLPVVTVYDQVGGLMRSFLAYDAAFRGGVHVAVADVTGDGVKDIIAAPGSGGGPHIKVFDGVTGALVRQWMAYAPVFRGGVFVAAAPINKEDDVADIVTGAGPGGGPHVKVFDGATGAVMSSFMAYDPAFTGGVNLAAVRKTTFSYVSGSGSVFYEIPGRVVTGTGPGGGPHVRIFDGTTAQVQGEFFAWPHNPNGLGWVVGYSGGVNVAADYPSSGGNSSLYIVAGAGPGVQPEVQVFDSAGNLSSRFLAYIADFRGGVTVDILPDPTFSGMPPSIITGTGPGGGPHVREWRVPPDLGYNHADAPADLKREFFAFDPAFRGGVFVG